MQQREVRKEVRKGGRLGRRHKTNNRQAGSLMTLSTCSSSALAWRSWPWACRSSRNFRRGRWPPRESRPERRKGWQLAAESGELEGEWQLPHLAATAGRVPSHDPWCLTLHWSAQTPVSSPEVPILPPIWYCPFPWRWFQSFTVLSLSHSLPPLLHTPSLCSYLGQYGFPCISMTESNFLFWEIGYHNQTIQDLQLQLCGHIMSMSDSIRSK